MTTDKTLEISHDADFNRYYIPLPGGWEVQTKGRGSSFRIANTKDNKRLNIPPSPYLFELLERMAREILAAYTELLRENAELRASDNELWKLTLKISDERDTLRTQVAALQRAVERKNAVIRRITDALEEWAAADLSKLA